MRLEVTPQQVVPNGTAINWYLHVSTDLENTTEFPFNSSVTSYENFNVTDDILIGTKLTTVERVIIGTVLGLCILFSIAGNVLVCAAVATEEKLRKTGNSFIVSLAAADLGVSIIVMTFSVANEILGYWIFAPEFCSVWISFDVLFSTASILNLCAISCDRYLHIKKPFSYYRWITNKRAIAVIIIVWVLSALISFLPIQLKLHEGFGSAEEAEEETPEPTYIGANNVYVCTMELNPVYAVMSSLVSFFIPCFVMLAIYSQIFLAVRERVKNARKGRLGNSENGEFSCHGNQQATDHKAAVTLGIIMGVFLFCWAPFFTLNVVSPLCKRCIVPPAVYSTLTWLGYFNSVLNPIIYSIFNRDFRVAFQRLLGYHVITRCCRRDSSKLLNNYSTVASTTTPTTATTPTSMAKSNSDSSVGYMNGRRINRPSDTTLEFIIDRVTTC
ncbi:dopamine receptor 1-like [Amphiura filiformis]|uniref:dopamine receptor 1-like n=1 Tax=Amphiura filiformis TaxID=82378 RepID=UPI003B21988B